MKTEHAMKHRRLSRSTLILAVVGTLLTAVGVQRDFRRSQKLDALDIRLSASETLLQSVAMPRYPQARVVVTKPDGRKSGMPLLQQSGGMLAPHDRRVSNNWSGPRDWGDASSGGYFWRYIGSEGDRDIYEFIVVYGRRLPPEPDEQTEAAVVRYVSFRGDPVGVISQNNLSISLVP